MPSRLQADAYRRRSEAGAAAAAVVNKYPLRKVVGRTPRGDMLECGHERRVAIDEKDRPRRRCRDCHLAAQPKRSPFEPTGEAKRAIEEMRRIAQQRRQA